MLHHNKLNALAVRLFVTKILSPDSSDVTQVEINCIIISTPHF